MNMFMTNVKTMSPDDEVYLAFEYPLMGVAIIFLLGILFLYISAVACHALVERATTLRERRSNLKYGLAATLGLLLYPLLAFDFICVMMQRHEILTAVTTLVFFTIFITIGFLFLWHWECKINDGPNHRNRSEMEYQKSGDRTCEVLLLIIEIYIGIVGCLVFTHQYIPVFEKYIFELRDHQDPNLPFYLTLAVMPVLYFMIFIFVPFAKLHDIFTYYVECSKDEAVFEQTRKLDPDKTYKTFLT